MLGGVALAFLFAACAEDKKHDDGGKGGSMGEGGKDDVAEVVPCPSAPAATIAMELPDFMPDKVSIKAGQVVMFRNTDPLKIPHTSTSGEVRSGEERPDGLWDTGVVEPKTSACVRIDVPGDYPFFCDVHPEQMQGTIKVE
jgi:plastocyanin